MEGSAVRALPSRRSRDSQPGTMLCSDWALPGLSFAGRSAVTPHNTALISFVVQTVIIKKMFILLTGQDLIFMKPWV